MPETDLSKKIFYIESIISQSSNKNLVILFDARGYICAKYDAYNNVTNKN